MALCIPKHSKAADENDDIFESQAETLDELLTAKLTGAECLDELVCRERGFHGAGHTDADESAAAMNLIREWIEDGKIKPVIDKVYPLSQTAEAHQHYETGRSKGRVVISIE